MADTLPEALKLFPQFADLPTVGETAPSPTPSPTPETPPATLTAQELLTRALQEFQDADTALRNGDFAGFGEKYRQGRADLDEANRILSGGASGATTTTSTTSTTLSSASA